MWRGSVSNAASCEGHGETLPLQLLLLHELPPPPAGHAVLRQGRLAAVRRLLYGEETDIHTTLVTNYQSRVKKKISEANLFSHFGSNLFYQHQEVLLVFQEVTFHITEQSFVFYLSRNLLSVLVKKQSPIRSSSEFTGRVLSMWGEDHGPRAEGCGTKFPHPVFPLQHLLLRTGWGALHHR